MSTSQQLLEQVDALATFYRAEARAAAVTARESLEEGSRYRMLREGAQKLESIGDMIVAGRMEPLNAMSKIDDYLELLLDHGLTVPSWMRS